MMYINQIHTSASQIRLEKLIKERLKPDADREKIDAQIWDLFGEVWAIMFTDLCGFSRGVERFGIIHFLQLIYESERLFVPCIDEYDGIVIKSEGDSLMVVFRLVNKALDCAIAMQKAAQAYNQDKTDEEKILLSIGLGYGRILKIGDADIFGAEVNAASKLGEDIGKAWEILATVAVTEQIKKRSNIQLELLSTVTPGTSQAFKIIYQMN
ncbi:Adenylate/guanylate cyclase catalytic domain protein [Planktothrix serta PCC 8927]|uniref:Adenylate/guanylate cyclase catalytic domain protein n=1 Tax=Planktothrix serta PCC 8927 TaxID=671068 RepID=A0A7Z9C3R6_9CYAN|nr:adenylate/guanylate cyclase domain-containing protein [Planktothrix serta]VXD25086.1 Adenylate/guanylate cyclase catalytic domain protein [Planktothrix serta PCC 8927]